MGLATNAPPTLLKDPLYHAVIHNTSLKLGTDPGRFFESMVEPLFYDNSRSFPGRIIAFNARLTVNMAVRITEFAATIFIGSTDLIHDLSQWLSGRLITIATDDDVRFKTVFEAVKNAGNDSRFLASAAIDSFKHTWEKDKAHFAGVRANSGVFSAKFSAHVMEISCRYTFATTELFLTQIASLIYSLTKGLIKLDQKLATDITSSDYKKNKLAAHDSYVKYLMEKIKTDKKVALEKQLKEARDALASIQKEKVEIERRLEQLYKIELLKGDQVLKIKQKGPDQTPAKFSNRNNLCFFHSFLQSTFHQILFFTDVLDNWDALKTQVDHLKQTLNMPADDNSSELSLKDQITNAQEKTEAVKQHIPALKRIEQLSIFLSIASQYLKALDDASGASTTISCPIPGLNRSSQEDLEEVFNKMELINNRFNVNVRFKDDARFLADIIKEGGSHDCFKQLKEFCQSPDRNGNEHSFYLHVNDSQFLINSDILAKDSQLNEIKQALDAVDNPTIRLIGDAPRIERRIQRVLSFKEAFTLDGNLSRMLELLKIPAGRTIIADYMSQDTAVTLKYGRGNSIKSITLTPDNLNPIELTGGVKKFIDAVKTLSEYHLNLQLENIKNDIDTSPIGASLTFEEMHTPFTLRSIISENSGELTYGIQRDAFVQLFSMNAIGHNVRVVPSSCNENLLDLMNMVGKSNDIGYKDFFAVHQSPEEAKDPNNWQLEAGSHVLIASQLFDAYGTGNARKQDKLAIPKVSFDAFDRHFELKSFARHNGSRITGGHWIAYRKVGSQWYELDDCRGNHEKKTTEIEDILKNNGSGYQIQHTFYETSTSPKSF